MAKCKCGHSRKVHTFVAWMGTACFDCKCDEFEEAVDS